MKKTILEISIILLVAIVIALIYNIIRVDGILFFPKDKEELLVKDSILFGLNNPNNTITKHFIDTVIQIDTNEQSFQDTDLNAKDSILIAKNNDSLDSKKSINSEKLLKNVKKKGNNEFMYVNYEQMKKIISEYNREFVIIDARRPEQFSKSHLANAINIFPGWQENEVIEKILTLPQNKTIIVYCDGGSCDSSEEIASLLANFGYTKFYIYEGGWEEWSSKRNIK
jgi:rhodanese-related sulfurtransferase